MADRQRRPPWWERHQNGEKQFVSTPTGQRENGEDIDAFLTAKRKKTTVFLDPAGNTSLHELKMMIAGITKVEHESQILYKDEQCVIKGKPLPEYGLNGSTGRAQSPSTVQLAFRGRESGRLETLEETPLSSPPKPPDGIKTLKIESP